MKREDLDETQKQKIVALSTLAGGLAGDYTAGIIAGAQGGKNAVENNVVGCSSRTCPSSLGDGLMRGGGMGGGTTGGAAGAGIGAIIAGMFGDDKSTISDTEGDQIVD
ncbi:VENN motif pre-toxin domain-containing protein [Rahnella victoriana]|uniref:VENN motif pre-toxin domain-containing protein n=1 Tax=Rahnella victoriana TaxID=1510570 RepID=UPI001F61BD88|nr:VENN motif pre-toxin domain-containing protein [Rahnella victoriana]